MIATPIPDPDRSSEIIGALMGVYDWPRLTAVTEAVRRDLAERGVRTEVIVAQRDGTIIGGSTLDRPNALRFSTDWEEVGDFQLDVPDYVVLPLSQLLVGRASLGEQAPEWRLLVVESLHDALAPVHRLTNRMLVALALTLAAALALATLAGRRVVQPLTELTQAIRTLARRDLSSLRVPVRTQDEVGVMANAFNTMADDLDQAKRDLVDAAKFALVGELAAGVAHEVRTSLGVLRSSAQILERSLPADSEAESRELAQLIRAEVDRLQVVVNELLELGRPRSLQLEEIPISQPVLRAIDRVGPQAGEKQIEIRRRLLPRDPHVLGDAEMLHQVVLNLLVNSIQALEPGGSIEVSTFVANGSVGFEIRDDGPGIPDALRETLFHPFATGRDGGMGLGLTFVQRVVYEHHGRIRVESEPADGTRFRVELPAVEADR